MKTDKVQSIAHDRRSVAVAVAALSTLLGLVAVAQLWLKQASNPSFPGVDAIALLHLPHWYFWIPLTLVAWDITRGVDDGRRRSVGAIVVLTLGLVVSHAVFVATWDVVVLFGEPSVRWSTVFVNHLKGNTLVEFMMVVPIVGLLLLPSARPDSDSSTPDASPNPNIAISEGPSRVVVRVEEIAWVESAGNYLRLHTQSRAILARMTMHGFMDGWGNWFIRVHRSYAVNRDHVAKLDGTERWSRGVVLDDGTRVAASGRKWSALVKEFGRGIEER